MDGICLLSLVGIPASGKTTFSKDLKRLLENDEERKFDVKTICFDDFDNFNNTPFGWKSKRKSIFKDVEKLIDVTKSEMNSGAVIILLDDNMYYRSMRYEYVKLAKLHSIGFCQIYLESDLNTALHLNQKRSVPVPDNIIQNIHTKMEKPSPERFSWETKSITFKSYSDISHSLRDIKRLILSALHDPLKADDAISVITPQSDIHLADIAMRRLISYKIKCMKPECHKEELKEAAFALLREKQCILAALKSNQMLLPECGELKELDEEIKIKMYYNFFSSLLFGDI